METSEILNGQGRLNFTTFIQLSQLDLMDGVVPFADPLCDRNYIRLDRADDAWSRQLSDLLASYGLSCRVSASTHDRGDLLDVVVSRENLLAPSVDAVDVGLSDHRSCTNSRRWSSTTSSLPDKQSANDPLPTRVEGEL